MVTWSVIITRLRNHAGIDHNYERTTMYAYVAMHVCYIVRHQLPWQLCNYKIVYVTLYYVSGMVMIMLSHCHNHIYRWCTDLIMLISMHICRDEHISSI